MGEKDIQKICNDIKNGRHTLLSRNKIDEQDLLRIAEELKKDETFDVSTLVNIILRNNVNENCDWNIGSILQHFDYNSIVKILSEVKPTQRGFLFDSIGFCWVLGEFSFKNEQVIEFLYDVINEGRNPESWWRAAFALEKITGKNAVNNLKRSLKTESTPPLDDCLADLTNKRNVISILLYANNKDIKEKIYPSLKRKFSESKDEKELINIVWLLGRLRLYDSEMLEKSVMLLETTTNYETKYYILQAMIDDPKRIYLETFRKALHSEDTLIKKMAIKGFGELGADSDVDELKRLLGTETNANIISAITEAIYKIKSNFFINRRTLSQKYLVNENGLIGDDSDKWYADASIYNLFSEAEDPMNICFEIIFKRVLEKKIKIVNPIDLATGTGRAAKYLLNNVDYDGTLYAVDYSQQMLDYFERTISRQKYYVKNIHLEHSKIQDFMLPHGEKSSFVISSFGFPSKISDPSRCRLELESVNRMLTDDGVFVTLGWDETFNDDLNNMWYKYIPDDIRALNFEEWRTRRAANIGSPRGCDLTWYRQNIKVPLLYDTLEESINVMGHLFGRDAASAILESQRVMWWMSMGITWDNKESIEEKLKKKTA